MQSAICYSLLFGGRVKYNHTCTFLLLLQIKKNTITQTIANLKPRLTFVAIYLIDQAKPMRNRFLYCIFCLNLFFSKAAQSQLQKIYLQPKSTASEKQSQIVDSIRFIPLEVREDIQLSDFNYVTITSRYFMIVDYPEKRIFLYAKNGAFVKQISYKKLGEGFFPSYYEQTNQIQFFGDNRSYALTRKDRVQILQDWDNPRNKKYFRKYSIDLTDTSFLIKKVDPAEADIIGANPYYDDYYWSGKINTSELYKDSMDYELKIYKNDKLVKGLFPYNRINEPRFLYAEESVSLSKNAATDTYMLTRPFCDTIYKMTKDSAVAAFQLVLPLDNSLPASFFTKPFKNKIERDNFKRNNGWLLRQVYGFYESPQFIFFQVGYLSNYDNYLYQKQTRTTYKSKNIKADSTQYNLALLSDFGVQRNGDKFYKTQKAGDLVAFFEQHKAVPVPKELESFLRNKPNSTSPVIIEFKLKN